MTLKEKIIEDRKSAMLNRDTEKKLVLGTLLGELDRLNKNPSDAEVISTIKKMLDNNTLSNATHENKHLIVYLPELMSVKEIDSIISKYIEEHGLTNIKSMGLVMNFLKTNYTGQYNGKIASEIIKEKLI